MGAILSQGLPIPRESRVKQATLLALLVHVLLLLFLWVGIRWQNEAGGIAQAEVWDITVEAAPRAPDPVVQEEVKPVEETKQIEETPETRPAEKPDIALAEEEKRKEEKKRKEEQAKRKVEERAEQKKAQAVMEEEKRRIMARSGAGGSGQAAYSAGSPRADTGYIRMVGAKIKSNTVFGVPTNLGGNPPVEYDVSLLPDGSLKGVVKRKSSGVPGFDEAVLRAIQKSAPYPADKSGRVPSGFVLSHKPKG
ncbi:MAG: TonB family protein [Burkholderiaceae bacterium]|jgi:colicin import membrane protein|nr:TonB family protein [Burkholderiaceae bacterium]